MPVKHEGIIKRADYYQVDPRIIKVVKVNRMMNRRAIEKLLAERKGVYASITSVEAEYRNQGAIEALETVLNNQAGGEQCKDS